MFATPPGQRGTRRFRIGEAFSCSINCVKVPQGWVSKVLMGLLILSFAIWGIGGFQGYQADRLAWVGDAEVTVRDFAPGL